MITAWKQECFDRSPTEWAYRFFAGTFALVKRESESRTRRIFPAMMLKDPATYPGSHDAETPKMNALWMKACAAKKTAELLTAISKIKP